MSKVYKMLQIPVTKEEYDRIMSLAKKENRSIPSQIKVTLKIYLLRQNQVQITDDRIIGGNSNWFRLFVLLYERSK